MRDACLLTGTERDVGRIKEIYGVWPARAKRRPVCPFSDHARDARSFIGALRGAPAEGGVEETSAPTRGKAFPT